MSNLWIINAYLPPGFQSTQEDPGYEGYEGTWTVQCSNGMVTGVFQTGDSEMGNPVAEDLQLVDARGGLVLPSYVAFKLKSDATNRHNRTLSRKVVPCTYSSRQMLHLG